MSLPARDHPRCARWTTPGTEIQLEGYRYRWLRVVGEGDRRLT